MDIYSIPDLLSNHSRGIQIWDETESKKLYDGEVDELRYSDIFDDIQDEEVVDLYALDNGTIIICIDYEG